MYRKSKMKIIALVMGIFLLMLLGTIGIIYFTSYQDVYRQNREMLARYVQEYRVNGAPRPEDAGKMLSDPVKSDRRFRVSTFYSVSFSPEGKVLEVVNDVYPQYDEAQLTRMAAVLARREKEYGTFRHLAYLVDHGDDYMLVALMDNTVIDDSIASLLRNTLVFGIAALVLFTVLSVFFAGWIIRPLEENHRRQKQFISDAGHELKTPVSNINANLDLLAGEIGPNRWLENIQWETGRMQEMIRQFLELARAETVKPVMDKVDLSRIVEGGLLSFEAAAFEKGVLLKEEIQPGVRVTGNRQQLTQLTDILVDNGLRYSSSRGELRVSLKTRRGLAYLTVGNQGPAIPPEIREKIFDRFYQADASRSDSRHFGLGLAIAKAITVSHRGKISVNCHEGVTEFTVALPIKH